MFGRYSRLQAVVVIGALFALTVPRSLVPCCPESPPSADNRTAPSLACTCCQTTGASTRDAGTADGDRHDPHGMPAEQNDGVPPCTGCLAPCCAKVTISHVPPLRVVLDGGWHGVCEPFDKTLSSPALRGIFRPPRA